MKKLISLLGAMAISVPASSLAMANSLNNSVKDAFSKLETKTFKSGLVNMDLTESQKSDLGSFDTVSYNGKSTFVFASKTSTAIQSLDYDKNGKPYIRELIIDDLIDEKTFMLSLYTIGDFLYVVSSSVTFQISNQKIIEALDKGETLNLSKDSKMISNGGSDFQEVLNKNANNQFLASISSSTSITITVAEDGTFTRGEQRNVTLDNPDDVLRWTANTDGILARYKNGSVVYVTTAGKYPLKSTDNVSVYEITKENLFHVIREDKFYSLTFDASGNPTETYLADLPEGIVVKNITETLIGGVHTIYANTDRGIVIFKSDSGYVDFSKPDTYDYQILGGPSLYTNRLRIVGNMFVGIDYVNGRIDSVQEAVDMSWVSDQTINLEKSILSAGDRTAIVNAIKSKVSALSNAKADELAKLEDRDWQAMIDTSAITSNLTTSQDFNKWFTKAPIVLGSGLGYVTSGTLNGTTNEESLDFLSSKTITYTDAVEAKTYSGEELTNMIEVINTLIKKQDSNLEVDASKTTSLEITNQGDVLKVNVKPVSTIQTSTSLSGQINVEFTKVAVATDLAPIKTAIEAKTIDVEKKLDVNASKADFNALLQDAIKDVENIDQVNVEIADPFTTPVAGEAGFSADLVITDTVITVNKVDAKIKFVNVAAPKVEISGSWENGIDPTQLLEGQSATYVLNGSAEDLGQISASVNNTDAFEVKVEGNKVIITAKKPGDAILTIHAENGKEDQTITVKAFSSELEYDIKETVKINQGKSKSFALPNAFAFDQDSFTVTSSSENNLTATIDKNGKVSIKAVLFETEGQTYTVTVKAKDKSGIERTFDITVEVLPKAPFPIWAIILIALLGAGVAGVGLYFLILFLFRKYQKDAHKKKRKSRARIAQIEADKEAVKKAKVTKTAKIKHDKGLERSGVFERDLEFNNEKLEDPEYTKKYVDLDLVDDDTVVNHWATDAEQASEEKAKGKSKAKKTVEGKDKEIELEKDINDRVNKLKDKSKDKK
ncbi:hypothetical protein SCHIN_v1c07250 [Spiroplasma chinense]|uniref:Cadherin domain-containing protein n=1 Tax=Spiroplasma chinense TaxID=216932 RepID=A0A5B9Y4N6_9MOLU|nr:hypothetical protein [Spiroplasma chinense]QEH61920.1 hypothetical protein SCHIN_v1c07250 [Spiroplasma chinense]